MSQTTLILALPITLGIGLSTPIWLPAMFAWLEERERKKVEKS